LQRLLFDQGLPGGVGMATALCALGLEAYCVGGDEAPPTGSPDEDNCRWCSEHKAILITHDRGKKDREILEVLDQHQVGVILVLKDLRSKQPYHLARAVLNSEGKMDQIASSRKHLRHYLRPGGGLTPAAKR
jgi:hypothetical protein